MDADVQSLQAGTTPRTTAARRRQEDTMSALLESLLTPEQRRAADAADKDRALSHYVPMAREAELLRQIDELQVKVARLAYAAHQCGVKTETVRPKRRTDDGTLKPLDEIPADGVCGVMVDDTVWMIADDPESRGHVDGGVYAVKLNGQWYDALETLSSWALHQLNAAAAELERREYAE